MLRRRNDEGGLPTTSTRTSPSSPFYYGNNRIPDGSGSSIKTQAPIVRAFKNASWYTKGTYFFIVGTIGMMIWGWKDVFYHYGSTHMNCTYDDGCTIKIRPPNNSDQTIVHFQRDQIVKAELLHVNLHGRVREHPQRNHPKTFRSSDSDSIKDVDTRYDRTDGEENDDPFESYAVTLVQHPFDKDMDEMEEALEQISQREIHLLENRYGEKAMEDPEVRRKYDEHVRAEREKWEERRRDLVERHDPGRVENHYDENGEELVYGDLTPLRQFSEKTRNHQEYKIVLRKYNVNHTFRRVSHLVTKINTYALGQRDRLVIRETRNIRWQGVCLMVFGLFGLLITILVGQFVDPVSSRGRGRQSSSGGSGYSTTTQQYPRVRHPVSSSSGSRKKAYGGYGQPRS